ncbi:MAG TPA: GNAT family N-acetyltransferase [Pyrinomonadaceae bacterium]|jgi:predicted GNAT family acetyltransferase
MKIKRQEHGKNGAFFIEENGEWVAEMTYVREGARKIVINHTAVSKDLKGKGIGKALVNAAVKFARGKNLLIKPECSFAKKVLESSEEYEDVLTR